MKKEMTVAEKQAAERNLDINLENMFIMCIGGLVGITAWLIMNFNIMATL